MYIIHIHKSTMLPAERPYFSWPEFCCAERSELPHLLGRHTAGIIPMNYYETDPWSRRGLGMGCHGQHRILVLSRNTWLVVWLEHQFWHFPINIGLMSSSQLTNSYFSEGWPGPPTSEKSWGFWSMCM